MEIKKIKEKLVGGIQDLINLIENSQEIDVGRNDKRSQVFEEIKDSLINTHNLFLKFDRNYFSPNELETEKLGEKEIINEIFDNCCFETIEKNDDKIELVFHLNDCYNFNIAELEPDFTESLYKKALEFCELQDSRDFFQEYNKLEKTIEITIKKRVIKTTEIDIDFFEELIEKRDFLTKLKNEFISCNYNTGEGDFFDNEKQHKRFFDYYKKGDLKNYGKIICKDSKKAFKPLFN